MSDIMTLMTFKIPDIACIGHLFNLLMYYLRGFACAWMALRARNHSPWGLVTLNPRVRATDLGQGPNLRRGVRAGSLRATEPRAREKTRGRESKNCRSAKKTRLYIVICVCVLCCCVYSVWFGWHVVCVLVCVCRYPTVRVLR